MADATYDFKKAYKDFYMPAPVPALIDVPPMTFIAVAGQGDPNEEGGAYARALNALYALSFTIKMSKKGAWQPAGYFDYVVPPLEGLWWTPCKEAAFTGAELTNKQELHWVSLIRQPDFVTPEVFAWALQTAQAKKPELAEVLAQARLVRFAEGPCVQMLHKGPYDTESQSIAQMQTFVAEHGISEALGLPQGEDPALMLAELDVQGAVLRVRLHHEIYLGDPRRSKPANLKTVIRHPVERLG